MEENKSFRAFPHSCDNLQSDWLPKYFQFLQVKKPFNNSNFDRPSQTYLHVVYQVNRNSLKSEKVCDKIVAFEYLMKE